MRRPRIGNQIADALLTAAAELDAIADDCRDEDLALWVKDLRVSAAYTRDLALWYREKKGVE